MIYFSVAPLVSICIIFFLRIIYIFVHKELYNFEFFFPEYCYIFQPVCTPQWPTCACPTRKGSAPSLEIFDYFNILKFEIFETRRGSAPSLEIFCHFQIFSGLPFLPCLGQIF